ncbi:MAG: long-chain fatty acid--CoA ligase [Actinomycetia bacterium]|nr:long-chain fatty acid--CoA ligase [Actinomycetes bacterium]
MHLDLVLDMAVSGHADRVAFGTRDGGLTYAELADRVGRTAAVVASKGARHLVFVGANSTDFPVLLFAAGRAGIPIVPLNYRLTPEKIRDLVARLERPLVVHDAEFGDLVELVDAHLMTTAELRAEAALVTEPILESDGDPETPALVLFTSGTTAEPKAAILRHKHLASYVMTTVEFSNASDDDASLVTVPTYHIAGVSNTVSNIYAGRRVVHLANFDPPTWLKTAHDEQVTHALVVPTMLSRIVEHMDTVGGEAPGSLRALAYGGAPMPATVIERALTLFPAVDFVNAYGLTETSSTIAVLGPDEHRKALEGAPADRKRLGSAGVAVPGVELEIRDDDGKPLPVGEVGELWVRGEQVSGEYEGRGPVVDAEGWFPTRDRAWLDDDGYLFIEGRSDDTIIRGGENIAPAEIEEVLRRHPAVADVAVVGLPDPEWGQRIGAAVVLRSGQTTDEPELQAFARAELRSSKTPDEIRFVPELPMTDTGKLLRREVALTFAEPAAER